MEGTLGGKLARLSNSRLAPRLYQVHDKRLQSQFKVETTVWPCLLHALHAIHMVDRYCNDATMRILCRGLRGGVVVDGIVEDEVEKVL